MSLPRIAVGHRAAVVLATVLLALAGLYALGSLPAGIYPEVTFPRIAIVARAGTFEPRDMVVAVTRPMEEALSGVIGLQRIRTHTVRGATEISLDFRPRPTCSSPCNRCRDGSRSLQPELPAGIQTIVDRLTPSVFPMLQFELTGADPILLRDLAQYTIRPRLARLPDVGVVEVQGGLLREVAVVLDPARLVSHHISVSEVADRIQASNVAEAAGRIDREYRQFSILVSGLAATPEQIGAIVVRQEGATPVLVRDLGTVRVRDRGPVHHRHRRRPAGGAHQRLPPAERQHAAGGDRRSSPWPTPCERELPAGVTLKLGLRPGGTGPRLAGQRPGRDAHRRPAGHRGAVAVPAPGAVSP